MAGNTKLIGFDGSGQIRLQRWGGEQTFKISEESVKEIESICRHGLPKRPPEQGPPNISFSEAMGCRVGMALNADETELMIRVVDYMRNDGPVISDAVRNLLDSWKEGLQTANEAMRNYFDLDEPGVDAE